MADVSKYVNALATSFSQGNGKGFAMDIALPFVNGSKRINRLHLSLVESAKTSNVEGVCIAKFRDQNIASIVLHRIGALVAVCTNNCSLAYKEINCVFSSCVDYISSGENEEVAWMNLVLVRICDDLRVVAAMADKAAGDSQNALLREAINTITKAWTLVVKDRAPISDPHSKKRVLLAITNVLFKIYFTLNSLSLCSKLIDIIEGPTCRGLMDQLDLVPVCDVVMYKYYYGRLMMFEDKYENAREYLRMALRYCPRAFLKNRQRILASLIPIEMCLGVMPTNAVAEQYGFVEMVDLANATKRGDIRAFDQIMEQHQISFIKVGVYLVLEQVRVLAVRNFFKRVCFIIDSSRVSLETLEVAHKYLDPSTNLDQIECLMANLIFQGKVKGYMSHQKKVLILSKVDPFPSKAVVTKWGLK